MDSAENTNQIRTLNQHHLYFDHLILQYQIELMNGDHLASIERFKTIKNLMILHMRDEEKLLLPLYIKHISPVPPGGAFEFFISEHHRISRYMDQFEEEFSKWLENDNVGEIELVNHFDFLYKFKHLLEHHHTREDTYLYRLLDRVLDNAQKTEIMNKFSDIKS